MYITGLGHYVPERTVTNEELSARIDTSDEWIRSRTGIAARRVAAEGENCSDLVCAAAGTALENAGLAASDITHIIVCTVSGDAVFPSTASVVQDKLGIRRAMAFDLSAACSGFLYGLQVARGLLAAEPEARILLAGAEVLSRRVNWQDRSTCVLFGDGAGAAILSAGPDGTGNKALRAEVEDVLCEGNGRGAGLLACIGGCSAHAYAMGDTVGPEYFLRMDGREIFKLAVRTMAEVSRTVLTRLGLETGDIDLVVPHQANARIIDAVTHRLGVPQDKVFVNLDKYGNTSAASIPMALAEALEAGAIREGSRVLTVTFGAGLTWGAGVIRF